MLLIHFPLPLIPRPRRVLENPVPVSSVIQPFPVVHIPVRVKDSAVPLLLPKLELPLVLRAVCVEQNAESVRFSVQVPLSFVAFASVKDVKFVFEVVFLVGAFVEFVDVKFSELLSCFPGEFGVVVGSF